MRKRRLLFSERAKIASAYSAWAKEHAAMDCPGNMVTFLAMNKLINEDAAKEFVKKLDEEGRTHEEEIR